LRIDWAVDRREKQPAPMFHFVPKRSTVASRIVRQMGRGKKSRIYHY
jgi:hypothetical protein